MGAIRRKDFCIYCRKEAEYSLSETILKKVVRDKEYSFNVPIAICNECGNEMPLNEIIDETVEAIDRQYREKEAIVSISDIEKMMNIYKLGKAPLSLVLGFGEITITRYLLGQLPSKEYSDIIKNALTSPQFMLELLETNRDKIANAAYKKAHDACIKLSELFSVSKKMLQAISLIFDNLDEVTPLTLQKLLYFTQGISYALNGTAMFEEDCEAWTYGPVYPDVYQLFKDFKYNPIEDDRFAIIAGNECELSDNEKRVVELVANTFGIYGSKILVKISHSEGPWKSAKESAVIEKENIKEYFQSLNKNYDLSTEAGINEYIQNILSK